MPETDAATGCCPRCGGPVRCGLKDGSARCWCADFPPRLPVPAKEAGCYCPECLNALMSLEGEEQGVKERE